MRTYVLLLSRKFPKTSINAGEDTYFKEGVLNGVNGDHENFEYQHCKLHTIRLNYTMWEKRIKEVQEGKAVLSIRQWSGRPYRSKQKTILTLTQLHCVGIQKLRSVDDKAAYFVNEQGNVMPIPFRKLAENDGLDLDTFKDWFSNAQPTPDKPMAIIQFTPFRY